jgi:nitrate/TMAO reductase-like tetraheme cytochrome c subunit
MPSRALTASSWRGGAVGLLLGLATAAGLAAQDVVCAKCHANRDFLVGRGGRGPDSTLYVTAATLADTRHASLRCAACHQGYDAGYPHAAPAKVVPCETCHEAAGREWAASIHAPNAVTSGDAPTCVGCHGSHTVYGKDDRRSPTHPLNVAATCGRCHADPGIIGTYFSTADKAQARTAVAQFYKTVHGGALTRDGLVVSATCNDCHGAHLVLPADSAGSSVNRSHIPATCGACHVGITEVYDQSAHGIAYAHDDTTDSGKQAPVCVDCHSAHEIVRADQPEWFLGVVRECGSCHEQLYETYFDTYHGKVTHLGSTLAATCSDCHTPHNMRRRTDPQSSVYPGNLVATCGRCHPAANANFAQYRAHGDHRDRANYPVLYWTWFLMTALLVSVMVFFAIHTTLWLVRLAIDGVRGRRSGSGHGDLTAGMGTRS